MTGNRADSLSSPRSGLFQPGLAQAELRNTTDLGLHTQAIRPSQRAGPSVVGSAVTLAALGCHLLGPIDVPVRPTTSCLQ